MFFKVKDSIMFRNFESFGYITDNRSFGYRRTDDNNTDIGDKIVSNSGAIFFSVLNKLPQTLDDLAIKINTQFTDVDIEIIKNDASEFYYMLEHEGFIVSGETKQECYEKDIKFTYKMNVPDPIKEEDAAPAKYPETQDYFDEYYNGKPRLTNLHIEITSMCNERCVHCYIPHENKVTEIEANLFYDILDQCKNLKLLHLTLSGGEPMLHRNFCDFLKKCNDYNISVNVLTNLTLLNEEIINEMKANPLLSVQVSLYSMNPIIHDEITQVQGSFIKTKNAILELIENDIPLQLSCPIMKQNKYCYKEVEKWAKAYNLRVGSDFVIIGRYDYTTENLDSRLSVCEAQEFMEDIIIWDASYLEQIGKEVEKKKKHSQDDYVCSVCNSSICVTENGDVYPCAGWQSYNLGNIKENTLKDIWEKSDKIQYLRGLRRKDFPKCLQCLDKEYCTMCMVRNANEDPFGNPLAVNEHFCEIAKLNKKIHTNWMMKLTNI